MKGKKKEESGREGKNSPVVETCQGIKRWLQLENGSGFTFRTTRSLDIEAGNKASGVLSHNTKEEKKDNTFYKASIVNQMRRGKGRGKTGRGGKAGEGHDQGEPPRKSLATFEYRRTELLCRESARNVP